MPNALLSAYDVPGLKECGFALQANTSMTVRRESAEASWMIRLILSWSGPKRGFLETGAGGEMLRGVAKEEAASSELEACISSIVHAVSIG